MLSSDRSARALDLPFVGADPGTDDLGVVPGGVIPDPQDGALALGVGVGRAPGQDIDRHGADGAPSNEAQLTGTTFLTSAHPNDTS